MGFYDTTRLITGINLGSSVDTAVVRLHRTLAGPVLPNLARHPRNVRRFGCIDGVPADLNATLPTRFSSAAHCAGRFQAHDHTHAGDPNWFDPDIDIESLLYLVERTVTCSDLYGALPVLHGARRGPLGVRDDRPARMECHRLTIPGVPNELCHCSIRAWRRLRRRDLR